MRPNIRLRLASCVASIAVVGLIVLPSTATGAFAARASVGTGSATEIDPATYQCPEPGFVGFENLADQSPLSTGQVGGLAFSTSGGGDWRIGDFGVSTGPDADAKFPAGQLTSEQTHWATAADGSSSVSIDMTNGPASSFGVLVADDAPVTLEAFAHDNTLLTTAGPLAISNGRHMGAMQITEPTATIAYVTLDLSGSQFDVDSICTDAPGVPSAQLFLTSADGAPKSQTTVEGRGFGSNESVNIAINGCFDGDSQTTASGTFKRTIAICSSVPSGPAKIVATGLTSGITGTANFLVHNDWTQNGYNASRDAYNPFENEINTGNVSGLTEAWHFAQGGRPTEAVIAQGVVYSASADGAVYAVNDATGERLWSCVPGHPPCTHGAGMAPLTRGIVALRGGPVVDDGKVFVDGGNGTVYALDPATGDPLWHFSTGSTPLNHAPLSKNGILYVGSDNHHIYAINENTGKQVWQQNVGSKVHSTLAADKTHVYVGTDSGNLYAYNLRSGALAWTGVTHGEIRSSPAVADGVVFVGSEDGNVYAWSAAHGAQAWKPHQTGAPVGAAIAVGKGFLYVGTELGTFDELSEATGKLVHSATVGGSITSRAAVANGVVYVGGSSEHVYAFSLDLDPLWTSPVQSTNITEIAVTNGAIYFGSDSHNLEKFAL